MNKYYIDTCIWRDYFEKRKDKNVNLGRFAFSFLLKILKKEDLIMVSDLLVYELKKTFSEKEIRSLFLIFDAFRVEIFSSNKQIIEALEISSMRKVPFGDVLHAILSRDSCSVLVTRDRHFKKLKDISESKRPEDLT